MPAAEVKVAAMKGNVARGSVGEVMRSTDKMIPSTEMTELASNAGRGEMS
jgi:hypothetical protein